MLGKDGVKHFLRKQCIAGHVVSVHRKMACLACFPRRSLRRRSEGGNASGIRPPSRQTKAQFNGAKGQQIFRTECPPSRMKDMCGKDHGHSRGRREAEVDLGIPRRHCRGVMPKCFLNDSLNRLLDGYPLCSATSTTLASEVVSNSQAFSRRTVIC